MFGSTTAKRAQTYMYCTPLQLEKQLNYLLEFIILTLKELI